MANSDAFRRGVRHGEAGYAAAIEVQRAGYENYASRYDRLVGSIVRDRHYRKVMLDGMGLAAGSHVLVVACGTGRDLAPLQERVGSSGRITALDLTPGMLDQARQLTARSGWSNVEFVCSDIVDFPGTATYDAVVCSFAMSVIPDYQGALKAMLRLLKPGGALGIMDVKRPRSQLLLRAAHRLITWFLPEYDEDRPVPALLQQSLSALSTREFLAGYIYCAWGSKPA